MRPLLTVRSGLGPYEVVRVPSFEALVAAAGPPERTWFVVDEGLLRARPDAFAAVAPERLVPLASTEHTKSFEALGPLLDGLLGSGVRRDARLVAVGGGICQDTVGFAASILMRGVDWWFAPTTLLAQADSCIGAKTSINLGARKNQLGTFNAPSRVLLVDGALLTLPADQRRSGLGEVAKFHLLEGEASWGWIQERLRWDDVGLLDELVERSLTIKRRYIEEDEFDRGVRNLLNHGHTFGHAFEAATRFAIPHGMAVALGMCFAARVSERRGLCSPAHCDELLHVLRPLFHPFQHALADASGEELLRAMGTDKKNVGGKTYAILTRGPGRMEKTAVDLAGEVAPLFGDFVRWVA